LIQTPKVKAISRAHLPRLLDSLNWPVLNELIERCFGVRIQSNETSKWVAIDGKALRGTLDAGEKQNLILAVVHDTREVVAKARQCGDKSSEIPVVRELLKDNGLEKQKVSLDAHHFNPATTAQIHQAGGLYLTQVKENQATFLQQCKLLHMQFQPLSEAIGHKNEHGRVTTRSAHLFSLTSLNLDSIGIGIVAMIRCFSFGFSNIHGASMDAIPEKIMIPVKMDGTTEGAKNDY
jgi:hypothetical protein